MLYNDTIVPISREKEEKRRRENDWETLIITAKKNPLYSTISEKGIKDQLDAQGDSINHEISTLPSPSTEDVADNSGENIAQTLKNMTIDVGKVSSEFDIVFHLSLILNF